MKVNKLMVKDPDIELAMREVPLITMPNFKKPAHVVYKDPHYRPLDHYAEEY